MKMMFIVIFLLSIIKLVYPTTYLCDSTATCGCSTRVAALGRIVGGERAHSESWGWAVSLRIGNELCGGSIIADLWILTAAHCVNGFLPTNISVHAGSIMRFGDNQVRSVAKIIPHPHYRLKSYVSDIALLKLSTPLDMNDPGISILCLPSIETSLLINEEWPPARTTVVAIGWGRLNEGGLSSSTLQQVTLQTLHYEAPECTAVTHRWNLQLCAHAPCKDACQGDSGGPLMAFTTSKQWVMVGITSFGEGCARPDYAGIYTRISAYLKWIGEETSDEHTNPESSELTSSRRELTGPSTCNRSPHHRSGLAFLFVLFAPKSIKLLLNLVSYNQD